MFFNVNLRFEHVYTPLQIVYAPLNYEFLVITPDYPVKQSSADTQCKRC